ELRGVAAVGHERDVTLPRRLNGGDAGDLDVAVIAVAFQPAADPLRNLAQLHLILCGGRGPPAIASFGFPACSHAPMINAAVDWMDSDRRCSSTGFTFVKNFS